MVLDATFTNAASNALEALFLCFYFVGALIHCYKKDHTFSPLLVFFFLTLFVIKILSIYVHYYNAGVSVSSAWVAISLLIIILNYLLVQSLKMPEISKASVLFLSVASSFLFITQGGNFLYVAFPVMLVYLIAAYYSKGMLRTGFLMVVISNIIWIAARQITNYIVGHEIAVEYRYDNDIYHLLTIISTFIIYKAIVKGYVKYPI